MVGVAKSPRQAEVPTTSGGQRIRVRAAQGSLHRRGTGSVQRRIASELLHRVLSGGGPRIAFQPQLSLSRLTVVGYEALARFPMAGTPHAGFARMGLPADRPWGTEQWFALAQELGAGHRLAC
jgi:hypothetical protein